MAHTSSIPTAFEQVRENDEHILWSGRPEMVPFLASGIPFLVFGLLWGAIDYFAFIRHMKMENAGFMIPFFALHLFPFWASVLNMIRLWLVQGNTAFAITNKRLMLRTGFWGTDFKSVDYDQLAEVEVNVNPVENMYGVGSIRWFSASVSRKGRRIYNGFTAIRKPYEVFKQIKQVSVDIKTDWNYPNQLRPADNPGYRTKYTERV